MTSQTFDDKNRLKSHLNGFQSHHWADKISLLKYLMGNYFFQITEE